MPSLSLLLVNGSWAVLNSSVIRRRILRLFMYETFIFFFPCIPVNATYGVYGRIVPGLISVGISRDQEGRLVGAERVSDVYL